MPIARRPGTTSPYILKREREPGVAAPTFQLRVLTDAQEEELFTILTDKARTPLQRVRDICLLGVARVDNWTDELGGVLDWTELGPSALYREDRQEIADAICALNSLTPDEKKGPASPAEPSSAPAMPS